MMRAWRLAVAVVGIALPLAVAPAASAQGVDIEARPPERPLEVIPPPLREEVTRPPVADAYPDAPPVFHDPAFIEPLTVETETGRAGLSGWTAPNVPVGAPVARGRDVNGWLAVGFSITWGGPAPAPGIVR
jgi:hypothetical protein